jgi:hypothetical protein
MKKVLICGMLLGLLPGLAFAQRGRMVGGIGPSAWTANVGPMTPNLGARPNAVSAGHDGVAPSATPVGSELKTVTPSATSGPTASSVGANSKIVPDRIILPDAHRGAGNTGIGSNQ